VLGALRCRGLDLLDRPSSITLLTIGYMIARGLAKSGSR
jgi:hypothetical protein